MTRRRAMWTGVFFFGLLACAGLLVEGFLRLKDAARKASCRPEVIWRESSSFAADHEGVFPPLEPTLGKFTYDTQVFEPKYSVPDHICEFDREGPSEGALMRSTDPRGIDDWSYVYIGYCLVNEAQGLAFLDAYRKTLKEGSSFEQDLNVPAGKGNCGTNTLFRLREASAVPPKASCLQSLAGQIPVVIEWPGNHREMGGKVVYLDGTTRYVPFPGPFPMTRRFIDGLRALDAAGPPPQGPT